MSNSKKKLATEMDAETLRLHALMKERNEAELKAVEEMSKHPYSWEQVKKQEEKRQRLAGLEENKNETI